MAIKGRARKRSGGKGPALAPRAQTAPRRTPPWRRPWVRRSVAAALAVAAILGGLWVWQNTSHSGALRTYVRDLRQAEAPMLAHLAPDSQTNLADAATQFGKGQITAQQFRDLTSQWEKDFGRSHEAVLALTPPGPLIQANELLAEGIDGYVGVAQLYEVAAIERGLAAAEKDPKQRSKIEDQVQVLLQRAGEWRQRIDAVYEQGKGNLCDLASSWHIEQPPQCVTPDSAGTGSP